MQVNSVQSNDTSFGAKLVINDSEGLLRGIRRPYCMSAKKFRTFSEQELRQVEDIFEQKTKNITGRLELRPDWSFTQDKPKYWWMKDGISAENSTLCYFPNEQISDEQIREAQFIREVNWMPDGIKDRIESELLEFAFVKIFKKMPKSVEEFADKLVGAFNAMQHRFAETQQILELESKIQELRRIRRKNTRSELGKHLKINKNWEL